jgi:hypothetical protein
LVVEPQGDHVVGSGSLKAGAQVGQEFLGIVLDPARPRVELAVAPGENRMNRPSGDATKPLVLVVPWSIASTAVNRRLHEAHAKARGLCRNWRSKRRSGRRRTARLKISCPGAVTAIRPWAAYLARS